jgi:hypothetical protein
MRLTAGVECLHQHKPTSVTSTCYTLTLVRVEPSPQVLKFNETFASVYQTGEGVQRVFERPYSVAHHMLVLTVVNDKSEAYPNLTGTLSGIWPPTVLASSPSRRN